MQISVITPQAIDEVLVSIFDESVVIPPKKNIYRMKRDQDMYSWNFKVRDVVSALGSAPAVNRTGEIGDPSYFRRATFTSEWQFFWADVLAMYRYGKLFNDLAKSNYELMNKPAFAEKNRALDGIATLAMKAWGKVLDLFSGTERDDIVRIFNSLTLSDKFLTNKAGTNNCNNYITGDMRVEDPKIDPLVCAESNVEVLEVRTSTSGKTSGLQMARLNTFQQNETPPPVTEELLSDPRILWATVIYPDGRLIPFPNFDGNPVPYPYIAQQECWFQLRDLEKL